MDLPVTVGRRPRCPTDDKPLVRLYYQQRVGGRLETGTAPWLYCRSCERVFPATAADADDTD